MKSKKEPLQLLIIFPLSFYQFSHTLFGKTYTIWRNYSFCQIIWKFCQIVSLLPNRMRFCQKVSLSPNCIRLSPKGLYFLAKTPRTQVHPLPNVKLPLKTQENNELSDLCTAKNAVFTGFVRFPQLYPPKTKAPWQNMTISPIFQQNIQPNRRNSTTFFRFINQQFSTL